VGAEHAPLVLIEVILVFGGVLAFGWWQLRSVERDRRELQRQREAEARAASKPQEPASTEDNDARPG
jgi:cytochrome oxidase assembly protein ShyY1